MTTITTSDVENIPIGKLCSLVNGRAFKSSEWGSEGLPIIRIQNLNDEHRDFNYYDGHYEKKHEVNSGDLLFSWSGTPGTSFGRFLLESSSGASKSAYF